VRCVGGAGENEGGARRGHRSRDRGAEKLSGTDHSHTGKNDVDMCLYACLMLLLYRF